MSIRYKKITYGQNESEINDIIMEMYNIPQNSYITIWNTWY